MNARTYMMQVKKLNMQIEHRIAEIQKWQSIAYSTGTYSTDERVQSSGSMQKMAKAIENYIDIEEELQDEVKNLKRKKSEVHSTIEELSADHYGVLYNYYFTDATLQEVGYEMGKSYSWTVSTHNKALKELQRILDERNNRVEEDRRTL